ncbi:GDSL esterase/lipase EXL6 isoform X3 [Eutrema salsugineum]|uniref:GDSL esterase/lipase EXL6 isoform X3 n=1 Tax=Eutrema salsugineum TaxID=72664 RepID=UPI000CED6817|nr:GDSL esterase/lipase EXL6 isoform X3 [Eutrema salsugineum]
MFRETILVLTLFSICFLSSAAEKNNTFSALFAFGDSVLDTGNNNLLLTLLKGNYWPYGWNFDFKIPTGRFGNGRVFTDIVGGSGIDDLTSRTLRVLSAGDQVKDFKDYLKKLKKVVKNKKKRKEIISNAVFLISEGNNDLGYFFAPAIVRLYSTDTYTSKMVGWTKVFLQDLYKLGARKFAVMGVMPVGCLPFHRLMFSGVFAWCNFFVNSVVENFNTKLKKGLQSYDVEDCFKGAKFVYVDMYGTLMDLITNPKAYGFSEGKRSCCCMPTSIIPCKDPDQYVFYDFAHPSQKAYEVISKPLIYQMRKGLA